MTIKDVHKAELVGMGFDPSMIPESLHIYLNNFLLGRGFPEASVKSTIDEMWREQNLVDYYADRRARDLNNRAVLEFLRGLADSFPEITEMDTNFLFRDK